MPSQKPIFAIPVAEFAAALLTRPDVPGRAQVIADGIAEFLPETAVAVYVIENQENPFWTAKATAGEITVTDEVELTAGTLGAVAAKRAAVVFDNVSELPREEYAHLDIRRRLLSLAYVPLLIEETLIGAIELVQCEEPFPPDALPKLEEIAALATPAIAAALQYESERNTNLHSISRVTQMYDLEKVFNSTLEMEELIKTIASKFQEVMNVQAVNLWMVANDALELVECAGADPTVEIGMVQRPGDGVAGDVSEEGDSALIDDPEDSRLQKRNEGQEDHGVFSLVAAPLLEQGKLVGVVEAVNRMDGAPFDDDDQFLLMNICETASNALHNASLLQAERKVEILQTLVGISAEITATLNLDRVLEAVVNRPAAVIPYERAAVALESRGKLQLKAISGMEHIVPGDREVERLKSLLEWACLSSEEIFVVQREEKIEADREETRAKFGKYFSETGMRAFLAIPLIDDDGRLGILSYESSDPDFLTPAHFEMVRILAAQATVALRNASLYREVPLISFLEPLLEKKRKFLALEKQRRTLLVSVTVGVVLLLAICPFPMRVDGRANVEPAATSLVEPQVGGVVSKVYVREGDHVTRGQVLADLEDWSFRDALASAESKHEIAQAAMNRALAANDGTEAGVQRAQGEYWASEVDRAKQWLEATHLRSPIDGWVATPHVEDLRGRHLSPGDKLAEVVDSSRTVVDVAVGEGEFALLRVGDSGVVKLDGFPLRRFKGTLAVVSPKGQAEDGEEFFYARLAVPNPDGRLRTGMQGRAKIFVGWYPVGYVMFRQPAIWIYTKIWSWFGW